LIPVIYYQDFNMQTSRVVDTGVVFPVTGSASGIQEGLFSATGSSVEEVEAPKKERLLINFQE